MRTLFYKRCWFLTLFVVSHILVSAASAQETIEPTQLDGTIDWVYDLQSGRELAERENKPIWIVFRCER